MQLVSCGRDSSSSEAKAQAPGSRVPGRGHGPDGDEKGVNTSARRAGSTVVNASIVPQSLLGGSCEAGRPRLLSKIARH